MDIRVNKFGRRVFLPEGWENTFPHLAIGDKWVKPTPYKINQRSPIPARLWIERCGGGIGDIVHMLPAVQDKIEAFKKDYGNYSRREVAVIGPHQFILEGNIDAVLHDSLQWGDNVNHLDVINSAREYIDLLCPCADYERVNNYEVTRSRVELFYEACRCESPIRPPTIRVTNMLPRQFPKRKKAIGIGLRSTEKWRDWSLKRWRTVIEKLQIEGYFVVTFDKNLNLDGIPAVVNVPLPNVLRMLAQLHAFIGVDSGLTYIAAGLGLTTVGLYGETNGYTLLMKHYADGHAIQIIRPDKCRRPCYLKRGFYCGALPTNREVPAVCMGEITVDMVLEKFLSLAKENKLGSKRFNGRCVCRETD